MIRVGIVTISDGCANGTRQDVSGDVLQQMVLKAEWEMDRRLVVSDDQVKIREAVSDLIDRGGVQVVLTTGGTGLGPRDVTPEALRDGVIEREIPGFGEMMRQMTSHATPRAWLSRALAGIRGRSVIVCFPGSPNACREMGEAVLPLLPHALEMLTGAGH